MIVDSAGPHVPCRDRFEQTYFSTFKGMYFSGDGARRDEDGYYWITGRVDDVLNVSGHRLGTAEIESALVSHPKIAEAAVVGIPHNIKGRDLRLHHAESRRRTDAGTLYRSAQLGA